VGQDAASERHHCRNTNVVGNPRTIMYKSLRLTFFILSIQLISSCGQLDRNSFDIKKLKGLWTVTYSDSKDSYQEAFFTDSLVVLLGDDYEQRFRKIKITEKDSIFFYANDEIYLSGKIEFITKDKLKINCKDFKAELNKIHNLLLDDKVMADIIHGKERNEEKEELWRERFISRQIDWQEKKGLLKN
jgi:hypothetical protein